MHALTRALGFVLSSVIVVGCSAGTSEEDGSSESDLHSGHGGGDDGHGHGGGDDGHGGGDDGHGGQAGPGWGGHGGEHGRRDRLDGNGNPHPWGHGHHGNQVVTVPAPTGSIIANVNALGSGCPDGAWDASISSDGQTFTLRFNSYEADLKATQPMASESCRITVQLSAPTGMSYSVASLYYSGYVFLEQPGMRAAYTARYSIQEVPGSERNADRDVVQGPIDQEFTFESTPEPIWSPCGGNSNLNIDTSITVMNNPAKTGSAFMNNSAIDGTVGDTDGTLAMQWHLGWRSCH
jgi:hypothetical protein